MKYLQFMKSTTTARGGGLLRIAPRRCRMFQVYGSTRRVAADVLLLRVRAVLATARIAESSLRQFPRCSHNNRAPRDVVPSTCARTVDTGQRFWSLTSLSESPSDHSR